MNFLTPRYSIVLAMLCCLSLSSLQAQDSSRKRSGFVQMQDSSRKRPGFSAESLFADSGKLTSGDYMIRIEEVYQTLNHIQSESRVSREVRDLAGTLDECDSALEVVNRVVGGQGNTLDVRNLQMFSILLQNVQSDIESSRDEIDKTNKSLLALKDEMRTTFRDTALRQLVRDSVARIPFMEQLKGMRTKRRSADSLLRASLTLVNQLKLHASELMITCSELTGKVNDKMRLTGIKSFGKEAPFLWENSENVKVAKGKPVGVAYADEKKALNYYIKEAGTKRILLLLFAALFLWWIMRNLRAIKKSGLAYSLSQYNILYLVAQPYASVFVIMFCLAPLFDMNAPASYIESMQFFLLIALTFIFYRQWPRQLFFSWVSIVVLFLLFALVGHSTTVSMLRRYCFILLNISSIVAWIIFLRRLPATMELCRFVKTVLIINIALNVFAILFNMYGRLSLSHVFANTAIFAFTQIAGLSVLYKVIVEAVLLQVHASRVRQGLQKNFDSAKVVLGFKKPLFWTVLFIWIMVFTTNMNIYNSLFQSATAFLAVPRSIGSVSFTFGGVALFCLIIAIAHLLQRYIGYFMGAIDDDDEEEGKGQRSKLLVTKLVLITAGYLLAVAASGLPVDKITIVLGALGVGIGMGLQNIVNNFVSGIILIFDRPLQIGDSVEVGDKVGKVKEIGLRSSTLFTPNGAEVIIPNGDILSQQITNWTFSNSYKRLELVVTIGGTTDKESLEKLILEALAATPLILQQRQPSILFESVKEKEKEMTLKIYFWCTDVQKAELAQSSAHFLIYQKVTEKGLELK